MRMNFVKLDPNGNITLLVTSPVPRAEQAGVAARLMRGDVLGVEVERAGGATADIVPGDAHSLSRGEGKADFSSTLRRAEDAAAILGEVEQAGSSAPIDQTEDAAATHCEAKKDALSSRFDRTEDLSSILGDVEQVGFVEPATLPGARARLQMMGGEFCGNASMSLAALLAWNAGLAIGSGAEVALDVSGANGLVNCQVERAGERDLLGSASMPLPEEIREAALPDGAHVPLVRFPGIAHLIVPEGALSPADAEALAPHLCVELRTDALGLLFVNPAMDSMRPLVYVRSTGSAVWERGCGSGTAALGAYAATQSKRNVSLRIAQPGGTITVRATRTPNKIQSIQILGQVRIIASGKIDL